MKLLNSEFKALQSIDRIAQKCAFFKFESRVPLLCTQQVLEKFNALKCIHCKGNKAHSMVSIFVICKSIFPSFEVGLSRSQCRQSLYLWLPQNTFRRKSHSCMALSPNNISFTSRYTVKLSSKVHLGLFYLLAFSTLSNKNA